MKVIELALHNLHNAGHFRFLTEFSNLINQFYAGNTKYSKLFAYFDELLLQEGEYLSIDRNNYSEQLTEANRFCLNVLSELSDMVNKACKHIDKEVAVAGNRLKIVLDAHKNPAYNSCNDETLIISNMIKDLEGKFSSAIQKIGGTNKHLNR